MFSIDLERMNKFNGCLVENLQETACRGSVTSTARKRFGQGDALFAQRKISIKYKGELIREDSPYCIVFCRVLKRDVKKFEEALEKLKDKILLLGHRDYGAVCEDIEKVIDNRIKERKGK